ncbi:MAG: YncE family protein [Nocardioides sp.]
MRTSPWGVLVLLLTVSACGSTAGGAAAPATHPTSGSRASRSPSSPAPHDPAWVTGRVTTGSQPCGILGAAGRVWVSDLGNDDLVAVDPTTLHVGHSIKVGTKPCGLAFGGGSVWVEDYGSAQVTRVDARAGRVEHTYRVGGSPYDVTYAAGAAWVTNFADGTVSRVDAASGKVTTVQVGGSPTGIAPGAGSVWVGTGAGGIVGIDTATSRVTRRIHTPGPAGWTAYDARHVWVNVADQVWELDARSGRVIARQRAGTHPEDGSVVAGVAWVPDADGMVRRFGPGASGKPFASGVGNPFVLAAYRGRVWIVDFAGTDVVRLDPSRVP